MTKTLRAKVGWVIFLFAIGLMVAVPPFLYFRGLEGVPLDREPISEPEIPSSVMRSYWRYLQGEGDPLISRKNPYGFLIDFYREIRWFEANERHTAEYALLSDAARSLMLRANPDVKPRVWHLSNVAALIWVSRNWSTHEAIATVLHDTNFGNGFRGIAAASRGYFGQSVGELNDAQVTYLLVIRMAPRRFDPWCNPETHRTRFELFVERIGYAVSYKSIEVLPTPPDACSSSSEA